jgi:hypothetical protein
MKPHRSLPTVALAAAFAVGLVACSDDDNASPETTEVEVATSPPPAAAADTTEPAPDTTDAAAATTQPGGTAPNTSEPSTSGPSECAEEPTMETATDLLVGLSEEDATAAAEACGWILRVVRVDGQDRPVTMDLRPNRVNVEVADSEVIAVLNIG